MLAVDVEVAANCRSCLTTVSVRLGDAYGCVEWLWLSTALSTAPGFVHTACRSPNTLKFEDGEFDGWLGRALAVLESKAPCISSSRSTPQRQMDRNISHDQHIRIRRPVTLVENISWYRRLHSIIIHSALTSWNLCSKSIFHNTTLYIYTFLVSHFLGISSEYIFFVSIPIIHTKFHPL